MKTVLITGAAGFLGSHLCDKMIKENYKVICLDNFYSGSFDNIAHLKNNAQFHFIEDDVRNLRNIKINEQLDYILNFACPAPPPKYQKDPVFTLDTCYKGAKNCLELAKERGAIVLQASTSEVYGDALIHPQKEEYWGNVNPIGARSCYDEGKRIAETLFFDYRRKYNLKIKVIRIFNTYGARMSFDDGRVISNFIVAALKGEPITIYGSGKQTRSFCYADDLIDGIYKMLLSRDDLYGPVNLGTTFEFSVSEIASKIIKLCSSKSEIIYKDLPEDDPKQRKPDLNLARKELNYVPKITIEEGLVKTIEFFKIKLQNI
ncbi:MAG: SDR family oxidoreductase [Endomicrobium sp.]|jgi:UDP-glucuronate decarboxylase|nr:SDR family oxidoreductase [Endomicrobium sp.]